MVANDLIGKQLDAIKNYSKPIKGNVEQETSTRGRVIVDLSGFEPLTSSVRLICGFVHTVHSLYMVLQSPYNHHIWGVDRPYCPYFPCRVTGVAPGCTRHDARKGDYILIFRELIL